MRMLRPPSETQISVHSPGEPHFQHSTHPACQSTTRPAPPALPARESGPRHAAEFWLNHVARSRQGTWSGTLRSAPHSGLAGALSCTAAGGMNHRGSLNSFNSLLKLLPPHDATGQHSSPA